METYILKNEIDTIVTTDAEYGLSLVEEKGFHESDFVTEEVATAIELIKKLLKKEELFSGAKEVNITINTTHRIIEIEGVYRSTLRSGIAEIQEIIEQQYNSKIKNAEITVSKNGHFKIWFYC